MSTSSAAAETGRSVPQSPARRRWRQFRKNRRGFFSLVLFLVLFIFSLGAELISNDKPYLVIYQGNYYFPMVKQ
ncbi:MAG: hypothetical protein P8X39_12045, partial [Desulfofustis sp.]